jgi:dishevelled associated activator of morphogenesis
MIDTKSSLQNRKHTLLHYLSELLEVQFPDIAKFHEELTHVEMGSKVVISNIRSALVNIRNNLNSLVSLLDKMEKGVTPNKESAQLNIKFMEVMGKFEKETRQVYEGLDSEFKLAEDEFSKAVEFYGEDPKNMSPEEFFGVFSNFCRSFMAAKIDNEVAATKEAAEKKRTEAKLLEDEKRKQRQSMKPEPKKGEGGLDDLISSIRTGKAFNSGGTQGDPANARARRQKDSFTGRLGKKEEGQDQLSTVGVLGKVKRPEFDTTTAKKVREEQPSELAKLLARDGLKTSKPKKTETPSDVRASLRPSKGILQPTPSEARNQFEQAAHK